jgi:hypothetical protein
MGLWWWYHTGKEHKYDHINANIFHMPVEELVWRYLKKTKLIKQVLSFSQFLRIQIFWDVTPFQDVRQLYKRKLRT